MSGNIWVLAEHFRGAYPETTYEALALGRETADSLGVQLEAILLGQGVKDLASGLCCADRVLYAEHPALSEPEPGLYAQALAAMARDRAPRAIFTPLTNTTLEAGTLLAAMLGAPAVNFTRDVRVVEGKLEMDCVLYGGKIEVTVEPLGEPVVVGLWPGSRPADRARIARPQPEVETVTVDLPVSPSVKHLRYIEPDTGDIDITQQPVLVSVGRGIQSKENVELAEELAAALGGAVSGSRPVIDQGWLSLARQVGKSGVTVKPKIYIAAGISGAPEHVEGMRGSSLIIAINTDPSAPIFSVAHYGIVGDALDVLPALTEAVQAKKG